MAKYAGWSFTSIHITCRPVRYAGIVTGSSIRFKPVVEPPPRHNIPMSPREALTIFNSLEPGVLHKLHEQGIADPIALRAAQMCS